MNHFCIRIHIKLFLMLCLVLINTVSYAQGEVKISINNGNITIKNALEEVAKQAKLSVAYNESKLNGDKVISLNINNQSLNQALNTILLGTEFTFHLKDGYILIVPRKGEVEETKTITGRITDENGEPLPGVSVSVKGTLTGVSSDLEGNYSLTVHKGNTLSISFLGYTTQYLDVDYRNVYNIKLVPESTELDAVVVTALGIKRATKALSYNVQEVKQDEVTRNKDANFVNALTGKIAGVTINSSSAGAGGASKVVMRGTKSIVQSSNALYVIDGVPMFNLSQEDGSSNREFGSKGYSEGIADINPEDIESISVLTGAAAAALYGTHAANGAIVVTTKKGTAGKLQVTVSSNTEVQNAFVLPRFQDRYGTGDPSTEGGSTSKSWGPLLNDANYKGYSPREDFLKTGAVFTNSVSLSSGNEKNQTYFSVASVNAKGIVPNNRYERYNMTIRNTASFLKDKMKLDLSASYIIQKDQNMINQGIYSNPLVSAYLFPRGDDFEKVRIFERYDAARKIKTQYWPQGEGGDFRMQNPFWVAHRNLRNNSKKRYMLSTGLSYDILDWLNVAGRLRLDNSHNEYIEKFYASTIETIAEGKNGLYGITTTKETQTYADALLNINKSFDDISLHANFGASIADMRSDDLKVRGPLRLDGIPNVFNVFNIDDVKRSTQQVGWREQTQSIFGSVEVGWKNSYYLTLTGRNDWASQLAHSSQSSFFYPSVGLSAILSEIIKFPKAINYMKLRGSYSSVGMPYPRNLSTLAYKFNEKDKVWELRLDHYPVGDLKPERTNSFEVGLTTKFLKKFNLDLSYYIANTHNQTFNPQTSATSGYRNIYIQTGYIKNTGIEASLSYANTWNKFYWSSGFTFSMNRNKIYDLVTDFVHPETGETIRSKEFLDYGGLGQARFVLTTGGTLGDLFSTVDLKRDSNGKVYVDETGNVQRNTVPFLKLGSVFPKSNMAWRNDFAWKGFSAGFMVSARIGGIVYSSTQAAMDQFGVSESSAFARDNGGVLINGGDYISAQKWYSAIGQQSGIPQYYVYDATNVRLQEANIGYTIPRSKLNDIMEITVSVVGRNLWMIYNKAPFDPEGVATTGNFYQGVDNFMMPTTRNVGFNLRVKF